MVHDLVASCTMRSIKFEQKKAVDKILRHTHYQFTTWWPQSDPLWCPWYTVQDVLRKLRMPEEVFFAIVRSDPIRFYTWEQNDEIWVCARKSRDQRGADLLLLPKNEPADLLLLQFWGDALENLPQAAMKIHREKGVFYDGKREVTPSDAKYELGVVSYAGTGKYNEKNLYVPYHQLPDTEDIANEEQQRITNPPGQGWWPVIALQTAPTAVLIVCWYQLLSDGSVMCWWITC